MTLFLFWVFAVLMVLFGLGVVFFRNPVNCGMCLVMSFIFLAGLFVTLDAFFIAVVQVLVYAGAVMVLFLFIIMLLNLNSEGRRPLNLAAVGGGVLVVLGFLGLLAKVLGSSTFFAQPKPALGHPELSDVKAIGLTLFSTYNLPFQVVGVLLLVATLGVVLLSRKELK